MASEFEEYKRKKLFDDLVDIELMESGENDIVCDDCGCILFKLNYELGVVCADPDCNTQINLNDIEV